MYNREYCNYVYDFFNNDFFRMELGTRLGKCEITVNMKDVPEIFGEVAGSDTYGASATVDGRNYMWINPTLLYNKRLLLNTILHEMIHLYVNKEQPEVRNYRGAHGSLWMRTARYASELYGDEIGEIDRYASDAENVEYRRCSALRTTKTLANAYLVKLCSGDLVPVKFLTARQILELEASDIVGIYRVKPDIRQAASNRVTRYIDWDTLMDCVDYGIDAETESVCGHLSINLARDTDAIYVNIRRNHG